MGKIPTIWKEHNVLNQLAFFRNLEKRMQDIDPATVDFSDCPDLTEEEKKCALALTDPLRRLFGVYLQEGKEFQVFEKKNSEETGSLAEESLSLMSRLEGDEDPETLAKDTEAFTEKVDTLERRSTFRKARLGRLKNSFNAAVIEEWQSDPEREDLSANKKMMIISSDGTVALREQQESQFSSSLLGSAFLMRLKI